jgi:hypothetical protein
VEINASVPSGKKIKDPDSGKTVDEMIELLPAQYNTQTKLAAEVRANEHRQYDFDLKSK